MLALPSGRAGRADRRSASSRSWSRSSSRGSSWGPRRERRRTASVEQRMRAVIQPGRSSPSRVGDESDHGLDPEGRVTKFGARGSRSRGGSASGSTPSWRRPACRCDQASSSSLRLSRRSSSGVSGAALLANWLLAIGVGGGWAARSRPSLLRHALQRRADKLREQLPDVLTIMASSLRAGHSFLQSLDTVAKEITQPAAGSSSGWSRRSGSAGRPRMRWKRSPSASDQPDFKWAVLAVNIQREVGGNLAEILDNGRGHAA